MRYLLDSDTVSFALRGEGRVEKMLRSHRPSGTGVSAITAAELRFGAYKRGSRKLHRMIDTFLSEIEVLPFDATAADHFGVLMADLRKRGETLGVADTLIAAHALALNLTLVTHNRRHFERIENLAVEDWF